MEFVEGLLYVTGIALTAAVCWNSVSLSGEIESFSRQLRKDTARLLELRYREGAYRRLNSVQKISESVVETGTTTVRGIHRSIAKIPFGILESIPATRESAKIVRDTHDMISDIVYSSILGVNKAAGKLTRGAIRQRSGQRASNDMESSKE